MKTRVLVTLSSAGYGDIWRIFIEFDHLSFLFRFKHKSLGLQFTVKAFQIVIVSIFRQIFEFVYISKCLVLDISRKKSDRFQFPVKLLGFHFAIITE